jgi:hypothetical protein
VLGQYGFEHFSQCRSLATSLSACAQFQILGDAGKMRSLGRQMDGVAPAGSHREAELGRPALCSAPVSLSFLAPVVGGWKFWAVFLHYFTDVPHNTALGISETILDQVDGQTDPERSPSVR